MIQCKIMAEFIELHLNMKEESKKLRGKIVICEKRKHFPVDSSWAVMLLWNGNQFWLKSWFVAAAEYERNWLNGLLFCISGRRQLQHASRWPFSMVGWVFFLQTHFLEQIKLVRSMHVMRQNVLDNLQVHWMIRKKAQHSASVCRVKIT